jgi:hypothetical protein
MPRPQPCDQGARPCPIDRLASLAGASTGSEIWAATPVPGSLPTAACRELDDALGLTDIAITKLLDGRRGKNTRHKLGGLFRQSVSCAMAATVARGRSAARPVYRDPAPHRTPAAEVAASTRMRIEGNG